ncbi:MAG: hypothetical protein ACOCYQ_00555 [Alkalispirochaeta sp.]
MRRTHPSIFELRSVMLLFVLLGAAALLATPVVTAQEFTWGGTIDGTGSGTGSFDDDLDEGDLAFSVKSALWLRSFLEASGGSTWEINVQPSYTWTDERPYLFDVDRARIDMTLPQVGGTSSVLRGSVGRFRYVDAGGMILNHTIDGAELTWSNPVVRLRGASGYTGLVINPVSTIRMSEADEADGGDKEILWGPPRAFFTGEATLTGVFLRQSLTAVYLGQRDLRDADEDDQEDTLDSDYVGMRIGGPLASGLFQDVGVYLSSSTRDAVDGIEPETGMLATARIRYFRTDWNSSRFALRGVVVQGAGDKDDTFYTISTVPAGIVVDIPFENLGFAEASYGIRPFAGAPRRTVRDIQTGVISRVFWRMNDELPVDTFGANVSDDGRYIGTEVSANIGWRATSDLGTSITAGAFWPGTGSSGAFTDERKPEYLLRVQVSASF